ncbi:hypothetical protein BDV12DRAFT_165817 [Aspergillus spectabilis]
MRIWTCRSCAQPRFTLPFLPFSSIPPPIAFNMDAVRQEVLDAIESQDTIRIIADIPTNILDSNDPIASATDLIAPFTTEWETQHETRLLVVDLYPRHTYIVIDINNRQYDYKTADTDVTPIPIYILRLSRSGRWSFFRRAVDDGQIARDIAELHRCNGWDPTPFLSNHIKGPVYLAPRSPFKLDN